MIKKRLKQSTLLVLATLFLIGLISFSSRAQTTTDSALSGKTVTVRSGTSDWIEDRFQTEIVNIGLERLGYKTAPLVAVAYPALYTAVANGDLDIAPVFGDPGHNEFYQNAGGEKKLEKVGLLFPLIQGYQIDKKTADKYGITNLQQFQDPKIAQLFDSDGDGKADLVGCDPGWSCELEIEHQMDAYKLRDTVEINQGNYTALIADALTRYKQGKPFFSYVYSPFWLGQVLKVDQDVIWLEVPFTTSNIGNLTAKDTSVNGKNLGMVLGKYRVIANRKFLAAHPSVKHFLERVKIPYEDMIQESYRIKKGEDKPQDIRRHAEEWVRQNQDLFDGWLAQINQTSNQLGEKPSSIINNTTNKSLEGLNILLNPFGLYTIPLDKWITGGINFLVDNFRPFFQSFRIPINWLLTEVRGLLLAIPPLISLLLISLMTWKIAGKGLGIYSLLALTLIGFVGLWEAAMVSLALVVTAVIFCIIVGIPLGVACARSDRFEQAFRPLLDAMQTLPTFVYLVPVVMLFGIGEVPGVIATIIYALPPLIRFTNLGIRQVSTEVVEAAYAFGSTPGQILWEVQIPLAIPTILAGVNQTVLFALGMSVIASMIAVPGLGLTVLQGMGRLDVGMAAVGGLAIVLLAILLDRITQAIGKTNNS
ncbi:glycine betaine transporter subunit; membrane component of ABC superfamily (modular protein) [Planktothrix sp. PCC 11201]|uniref:glycine betaine/L-proline ABC transporter substrate-binding protein ProX n=1 Tax=Planktothrix sp. PCC 11201 TaxID=1729650 RepID=UPI0009196795|nr:glycine betaine/L-proline ABC transporter substrate-binding protein ProX [Planktothrix sp. PCC 11201]SKB12989.1 glycine betaine transporter subunit; membrane component of ABC superfamily (modular protein) [Planktothrix sp. PCC 11201]